MNLYDVPITGRVLIPADSQEDAETIKAQMVESLNMELTSMLKAENRAGLTGKIKLGKAEEYDVCQTTLERMTKQQALDV